MADRYWVGGSGNWSDSSHWSAVQGGLGGASVPSTSDTAWLDTDDTITIDQNISVTNINVPTIGTARNPKIINNGNYNVTASSQLYIYGNGTKGLGNGVYSARFILISNISNPGLASFIGNSVNLQSNNVVNHVTVYSTSTSDGDYVYDLYGGVNTLILDGSSSTNKKIRLSGNQNASHTIKKLVLIDVELKSGISGAKSVWFNGTSQIVAADVVSIENINFVTGGKYYVGADATNLGNVTNAIFADAPKTNQLTDNFPGTTLNSSKWVQSTTSGGSITVANNKVTLSGNSSSSYSYFTSANQYLFEGSSTLFELTNNLNTGLLEYILMSTNAQYGLGYPVKDIPNVKVAFSSTSVTLVIEGTSTYTNSFTLAGEKYFRMRENAGRIYLDTSTDGITFTNRFMPLLSTYGINSKQITAKPSFALYNYSPTDSASISNFNADIEPAASFSPVNSTGEQPLTITFTDTSNFFPTSWLWDFGDGTTSTVQNPTKTYSAVGNYVVTLTSSNSSYTRSSTGSVTTTAKVFTASISGAMALSGDVAATKIDFVSISGAMAFSGFASGIIYIEPVAIEQKSFLVKVYDPDDNLIDVLVDELITLPSWTEEINAVSSSLELELAITSDSKAQTTETLLDEAGNVIQDESNFSILTTTETRNRIGPDTAIDYNNRLDLYAFYGSTSPILDEAGNAILDEDGEEIIGIEGAPNGIRKFSGFISDIESSYGAKDTTKITVISYGFDLNHYVVMSGSNTTVPYNSFDPSNIVKSAMDSFLSQSMDTYTTYAPETISTTGTTVSYTFRQNTIKQVLDKAIELAPTNWYYRVDLGNNNVYFRQRPTQPAHLFILGKHIQELILRGSIEKVINDVLFTGGIPNGQTLNIYNRENVAPSPRTRRGLYNYSDNRVTTQSGAEILSEAKIDEAYERQYKSTVTILSKVYDIETINVGQVIGFRNFDNYVDDIQMQIVAKTYHPDYVTLQLDTLSPSVSKRLEDIKRQLVLQENQNTANSPT